MQANKLTLLVSSDLLQSYAFINKDYKWLQPELQQEVWKERQRNISVNLTHLLVKTYNCV